MIFSEKNSWLSEVISRSVASIFRHWDLNELNSGEKNTVGASAHPIIKKSKATVLCLHCFGANCESFKFCQQCGILANSKEESDLGHRIFNSEGLFAISKYSRGCIENRYKLFLSYRASSHNSKAIVSTMRCFEKFILSFGLARHSNSSQVPKHWTVLDASDSDVINFCIWKSLNGAGRTFLHDINCLLLGENKMEEACGSLGCEKVISAEYLRTGVISKLKEGFKSIGLSCKWDEIHGSGNPAMSLLVSRYLKMVQEQHAKAGIVQKQAAIFVRSEMNRFLSCLAILLQLPEFRDEVSQFEIRMLRSLVSVGFASSKRCDDLCWILIRRIVRLPNDVGLIINFQFGKTLRQMPNHVFGLSPLVPRDPWFCPVVLMEDYVNYGSSIGVDMRAGFLFTSIDANKKRSLSRLSTTFVNARFHFYLQKVHMNECHQGGLKLSIHSLRASGAISKLLEGQSLRKVMSDAYWKNPATAWRYIKLFQVMFPFRDFGLELAKLSPEDYSLINALPLTKQGSWFQAFPSSESLFDKGVDLLV